MRGPNSGGRSGPLDRRVADLIVDFRDRRVSMPREDRDELSTWLRNWLHAEAGRGRAALASMVMLRVTRLVPRAIIPGAGHGGEATLELLAFVRKLLTDRPANRHARRPVQPVVLDVARKTSGGVFKPVEFNALVLDEMVDGVKKGASWSSWA